MKKISQLTALLASLVVPLFATAQAGIRPEFITPYSEGIKNVINNILVPVLMALAFVVFLWGVYKYFILGASSDTERKTGRDFTLWGIIGFVIILSIWGIVNLFMSTLGLSVGTAPAFPTIGGSTGGGNMTTAQVTAKAALDSLKIACEGSPNSSSPACTTYNSAFSAYNTQYGGGGNVDNGMGFVDGSVCNADWQCANGSSCLNNVCASGMGVSDGSSCTSDWQCANGSSCINNTCASGMGVSDGSSCTSDWQCANGSSCINNTCASGSSGSVGSLGEACDPIDFPCGAGLTCNTDSNTDNYRTCIYYEEGTVSESTPSDTTSSFSWSDPSSWW